jgi:hypothetical protein
LTISCELDGDVFDFEIDLPDELLICFMWWIDSQRFASSC